MYLNSISVHQDEMSLSEVQWTVPHIGQNCVKNTTLYIHGSMLVCNSPAVSSKLFTALFCQVIKISLNKM